MSDIDRVCWGWGCFMFGIGPYVYTMYNWFEPISFVSTVVLWVAMAYFWISALVKAR